MAIPDTTNTYGKVIPQTFARAVTNQSVKVQGFAYPLEDNPGNGYFTKMSGPALVKAMVKNLTRTSRGERFMLPDYGVNLRRYLMEPLDETTFNLIREELETAVRKYLPFLSLTKIQVFETRGNNINIKLFLSFRNAKSVSFDVGVRI